VRVNGEIVRGCLMLAVQAHGASVETIEGLSDSGEIADLQAAFRDRNALQCGFCTPGMLMAAQDLLKQEPNPIREQIREHLSGNYCRCTGYQAIVDAVETTARRARGARAMKIATTKSRRRSRCSTGRTPISASSVPRPNLERLMQGRGLYTSATWCCRAWRMSCSCARRMRMRKSKGRRDAAKKMPGVIAVVTGAGACAVITPWVGVLSHLKGLKSAPQHAIAIDRACWQGEAVAAVVATQPRRSRGRGELSRSNTRN
jgi:carbon-monoxide dehydrogenase small subunit